MATCYLANYMKYLVCCFLLVGLFGCTPKYAVYQFDNGDDYPQDGMYRIVDANGKIGYANEEGQVLIKPQFACAFPFDEGKAQVAYTGKCLEVPGSGGEYHYWESDAWFYIDKQGNRLR